MKNFTLLMASLFAIPLLLCAQLPSGSIAKYQLDNTAGDIGASGYNGTLTSTTATTNRFSTASSATAFVAGSSTGLLPVGLVTAMSNDFTIGYWFKTGMTANSSPSWYGGNAMVDAEMCGGTSDWGTALINGGKICFGIGNPDITIISPASYNDNAWHFVTATRNKTAGTIILYVDGLQVATSSGTSTVALIAPTAIGLGRNPCASGAMFTGSLDDIIAYNRVLSGAEVTNLYNFYNGVVLPVQWISWNGIVSGGHINLQWQTAGSTGNQHYEIERSATGIDFSVIGTVAAGNGSYAFTDAEPLQGNNFYRIRKVDDNGTVVYSSTIKFSFRNTKAGIYLQKNPVAESLVLVNSKQAMIEELQITDASGRMIMDVKLHSSNALISTAVQQIKTGYYFLNIILEGERTVVPFMKQ